MQSKLLAGAIGALLLTTAAHAVAGQAREVVADEELVVALKTEHFEIPETDISHLAVGEAERIVTEYGRTVDLVRTEDGVEVYLDGQLLDIPMDGGERVIREEIEILCDTPEDCEEVRRMAEDGDVDLEALEAGRDQRLAAALDAAGLIETLQGEGPFTVFAPTDEAFAKLPPELLQALLLPENKEKLQQILAYHVIVGAAVQSGDLNFFQRVETLEGSTVNIVKWFGKVWVNSSRVTTADVLATNGAIHDQVLESLSRLGA